MSLIHTCELNGANPFDYLPRKRASQKANSDHVFGQRRRRTKMFCADLYSRVSINNRHTFAMQKCHGWAMRVACEATTCQRPFFFTYTSIPRA